MLNGIDLGALRGDLLDRLILVELQRIPSERRRSEQELDSLWVEARPRIHGALLQAASDVLRTLPHIDVANLPRMADHARILHAIDTTTGRTTLAAYRDAIASAQTAVLEAEPVAAGVRQLVQSEAGWEGTATQLLGQLTPDRPPRGWPTTPQHLSGKLKRALPALREVGVIVEFSHSTDRSMRLITISKIHSD